MITVNEQVFTLRPGLQIKVVKKMQSVLKPACALCCCNCNFDMIVYVAEVYPAEAIREKMEFDINLGAPEMRSVDS